MRSNFLLGRIVVRPNVLKLLEREPLDLLARHAINDHGLISVRDSVKNRRAMDMCDTIVSRYHADPTDAAKGFIVIKTEAGWARTVVTLEKQCRSSSSSPAPSARRTKPSAPRSAS